jgi:hypothetical protein
LVQLELGTVHAFPQVPQEAVEVVRSTQAPLHTVAGLVQANEHLPAAQVGMEPVGPAGQE